MSFEQPNLGEQPKKEEKGKGLLRKIKEVFPMGQRSKSKTETEKEKPTREERVSKLAQEIRLKDEKDYHWIHQYEVDEALREQRIAPESSEEEELLRKFYQMLAERDTEEKEIVREFYRTWDARVEGYTETMEGLKGQIAKERGYPGGMIGEGGFWDVWEKRIREGLRAEEP